MSPDLDKYKKELETIADAITEAAEHLTTHNYRFINLLPKMGQHSLNYYDFITKAVPYLPPELIVIAKKDVENYNTLIEEFMETILDMAKAQGELGNAYVAYLNKVSEVFTAMSGKSLE